MQDSKERRTNIYVSSEATHVAIEIFLTRKIHFYEFNLSERIKVIYNVVLCISILDTVEMFLCNIDYYPDMIPLWNNIPR
jgi:hypothetical protein